MQHDDLNRLLETVIAASPWQVLLWLGLVNAVTVAAYFLDKRAAVHREWRIPEKTLHILALAGGSPGAYIAQRLFRHKTRKQTFQGIFWLIVVGQLLTLGYTVGTF